MTHRTGIQIVESFFAAATAFDMDAAFAHFTDDIEYQNVPLPPDRGRKYVERTLRAFMKVANVFEVKMHHIAETEGVVLTERTDILRGPLLDTEFWVCGTFVIRGERIAVWRDRFDVGQVTSQMLTSPLRKLARRAGPPHRSSPGLEPAPFFVGRSAVLDTESSEIAWYDVGIGTAWHLVGDAPEALAERWVPDASQFRLLSDRSVVIVDARSVHVHPDVVLESELAVEMVNGTTSEDLWVVADGRASIRRCRLDAAGTTSCEDIPAADAERFCVASDGAVYFASDTSLWRHDVVTTTVGSLSEPLQAIRCTDDGLLGWGVHTIVWELSDGLRSYDAPAPTTVTAADRPGDDVFVSTREQEQPPPSGERGAVLGCETIVTTPCEGVYGPPGFEPWSQYVLTRVVEPSSGPARELAHQDCVPPAECWRDTIREIAVDRARVLLLGTSAWSLPL